jgi:hypothetical protein
MAALGQEAHTWVTNFVKNLLVEDISKFVVTPDDFAYQGFDPIKTLIQLYNCKKENNRSDDEFKSDMSTMICFGLMRGTLSAKSMSKMAPEGVTRIQTIQAQYKIVGNVTTGSPSTIVTIPRVINALPLLASKINEIRPIARSFNGELNSKLLPNCMQHTGFAALIPRAHKIGIFLQNTYVAHSFDLHCVVNQVNLDKLTDSDINNQYMYFKNSLDSQMYDDISREKIIRTFSMETREVYENLLIVLDLVNKSGLKFIDSSPPTFEEYSQFFQGSTTKSIEGPGDKKPESDSKALERRRKY